MNKNNIIFLLNDSEKIVIDLEEPLEIVHCCYQTTISLYFENKEYHLKNETVRYRLERFAALLKKCLNNKLKLHKSIKKDIGYVANEELQEKPGIVYKTTNAIASWVGEDYSLWSGDGFCTWFFNDKNGNVVFEITPHYQYHFCEPEEIPNFISYDTWAEEYKPYLIRCIPRDIAQHWLDQARSILNTIEETMARERRMFVNDEGKDIYSEWCDILEKEYGLTDPRGKDANEVPAEFQTDEWWKKRGL
jgi:hypothetical protein